MTIVLVVTVMKMYLKHISVFINLPTHKEFVFFNNEEKTEESIKYWTFKLFF